MNKVSHNISLDVNESSSQCCISAKKGETSKRLVISLSANGQPYTIADDCYAVFSAVKTDGSILYHDCVIQNNTIVYDYQAITTSTEGRIDCEIILFGGDSQILVSPRFAITVYATVLSEEEVESSQEVDSLVSLISKAHDVITETEEALDAANTAAETANTAAETANTAAETANTAAENAVQKTGDTMTGTLTVEGNFGEAFKARRSVILSGTTKRKRLYSGIKVDGNDLLGHIQCADETGSDGVTGLIFRKDGLYQNLRGTETKLVGSGGGGGSGNINFENCGTAALMRTWNNDYGMYETIGYGIHNKILSAGKYLILCDLSYSYSDGQENRVRGVATVVADLTGVIGNVDSFTAEFIGSTDYSSEGGNLEYYLTEVEFDVRYHSTMGTNIDIPNLIWDEGWSGQQMEAMFTFIKIG